jgi:hypothetical protein
LDPLSLAQCHGLREVCCRAGLRVGGDDEVLLWGLKGDMICLVWVWFWQHTALQPRSLAISSCWDLGERLLG